MHRFLLIFLAAGLLGCGSNEPELATGGGDSSPAAMPPPSEMLSSLHVADPRAEPQLLSGFHVVEQGAWRWTEKRFSVALKTLPPVEGEPIQLELKFALPDVIIEKFGEVALTARAGSASLGSETYNAAGDHVFQKPVPPEALEGEVVQIDFELDKAIPPSERDERELGLVAQSIALK